MVSRKLLPAVRLQLSREGQGRPKLFDSLDTESTILGISAVVTALLVSDAADARIDSAAG